MRDPELHANLIKRSVAYKQATDLFFLIGGTEVKQSRYNKVPGSNTQNVSQ